MRQSSIENVVAGRAFASLQNLDASGTLVAPLGPLVLMRQLQQQGPLLQ